MTEKNSRERGAGFPDGQVLYSRTNSIDAFNTVDVLPNPDPVLKQVNSTWTNYWEILWDPHLTAVIASRKSVTLSKKWFILKNDAPARVTKLVEKAFKMFDVHRATEEILDCRSWGMQPLEVVWQRPEEFEGENKVFPVEFVGRPVWWFQYDRENHLRFRSTADSWPGEEIKPFKLITPRNNPKYENPYGEALLSKVYWSVNFKKAAYKFWVQHCEKYGMPIIEGSPPRNASKTEFDEFHEKLVEMTKGSALTIPNDAKITIHDTKAKAGSDVFEKLMEKSNAEISKAYLGQTLTTEAGDKGARALGQVHDNVRHDLAESDEILVEDCFNTLIRWIVDINFGPKVPAPGFKFEHEEDIKKDLAERDAILKTMGVVFTPEYYQENYNLSEKDFEIKEPEPPAPAPGPALQNDEDDDSQFQEPKSKFKDQRAVDAFIESLTDEELQDQAKFAEKLIKEISKTKSFSAANEKLLKLFTKIRPKDLEKELGRSMFNTEVLGRGGDD